jgi:hypothetical protein
MVLILLLIPNSRGAIDWPALFIRASGRTYGLVEDDNFRATNTQVASAINANAAHLGVEVNLHSG